MNPIDRAKSAAVSTFALILCAAPSAWSAGFTPNALLVADIGDGVIRQLAPDYTIAATFDGSGALSGAVDLEFGPNGHLFVARNDRIVEIGADDGVVRTIGVGAGIAGIDSITFGPDGHLFVTCATQDQIAEFDVGATDAPLLRVFGAGTGLDEPRGLVFGSSGNLFVASAATNRVLEFASSGEVVREIGVGSGLTIPGRLAFGPLGYLYVVSTGTGRIVAFDGATLVDSFGGDAPLSPLIELRPGPDSRMYVADGTSGDLFRFGSDFELDAVWTNVGNSPSGLVFAPYRFKVRLEGELTETGVATSKPNETAVLSIHPGADVLMLELPAKGPDHTLTDVSGARSMVFHGFQHAEAGGAKFRNAEGIQLPAQVTDRGTASLGLRIKGTLDPSGRFVVKKATGTLHRASGGFVYSGELTTLSASD